MSGKVLSSKNESSLKQICGNLVQFLLESGVKKESLLSMFQESETTIINAQRSFSESVKESIWFDNVSATLEMLEWRFIEVGCWCTDKTQTEITVELQKILSEFEVMMTEFLESLPTIDTSEAYYPMYCSNAATKPLRAAQCNFTETYKERLWREGIEIACRMFKYAVHDLIYECSLPYEQRPEQAKCLLKELCSILTQAMSSCPIFTASELKAAAKSSEPASGKITLRLKCSAVAAQPLQADAEKIGLNKQPFSGVLLRIDEPSDGAPSAGPDKKLYVPRDVAQIAVDIINASGGMPLDIKNDLSGHDDSNITGIMTSAAIVGKDFVVYGHLFPASKPAETLAIATHIQDLGMSINAEAASHDVTIQNPETGATEVVAWVDELYPLGANILYSKLATWQSTQVLQAQAGDVNSPDRPLTFSLNASATNTYNQSAENMNTNNQSFTPNPAPAPNLGNIETMLGTFIQASQQDSQALKDEIKQGFAGVNDRIAKLEAEAQERDQLINTLKAERAAKEQAAAQQKLEQEQQSSAEKIASLVQAELQKRVNPHGQPPSLTNVEPLVAGSAATPAPPPSNIERELIAAETTLEVMTSQGIIGAERIKASDQVKRLKAQLQQERAAGQYAGFRY